MASARRLLLALLAGAAVGVAFPPFGAWPLLLVGLVALLAALEGQSAWRGAQLGLVFGLTSMAIMLPWVRVIGPDAWAALTVLEALFFAGFGAAAAYVRPYRWWPVATACLWVLTELARSHVPFTGFPWGKVAFALTDAPVAAYVRYVGVPGLGALVLLMAAAVWWGLLRVRTDWRPATAAWLTAVAVVGLGAVLPVGSAGDSGRLQVAAVQGGIPGTGADGLGEQREVVDNHVRATKRYAAQVRAGAAEPADVVFWPENSTDIDPFADDETYAAIDGAVDEVGVPVLVGALTAGSTSDTRRNVGLVWSPEAGPGDDFYVKRNLVPFGEYIPLRNVLAPMFSRLDQIPRDFEPGDQPGVLDLGPVVVADAMCYDVAFEGVIAPAVEAGAELLVVQTNNATYQGTGQPEQQWAISRMRALEAGRDLVVASTNGISGVVAADGSVLTRSTSKEPVVLTATVQLADGLTPAVRFGSLLEKSLALLGVLAVAVALLLGRRGVGNAGTAASASPPTGPSPGPAPGPTSQPRTGPSPGPSTEPSTEPSTGQPRPVAGASSGPAG
jgi:apolipoprotein N-acyltransferase